MLRQFDELRRESRLCGGQHAYSWGAGSRLDASLRRQELRWLGLNNNRLSDLPYGIRTLTNLTQLDVEGNPIPSWILDQIAAHRWEGESSRPWQIGPAATPMPRILPMPSPADRTGPQRKAG